MKLWIYLIVLASAIFTGVETRAQFTELAKDAKPEVKPQYQSLKLHAQKAPVPALRYRLDPEMRNQESGNALPVYYRAWAPEWTLFKKEPDWDKKSEEWKDLPLEKIPDEIYNLRNARSLWELDRGANRSYMDWEMIPSAKKDGIGLMIPDVQGFRGLSRMLGLRCRADLGAKDFPAAIKTLRTQITLGRHCAQGPTLIQALVGIAICSEASLRMQEAVSQPGFPNLYWALMALPAEPVDLRLSMDGEKLFIDSIFPGLRDMLYSGKLEPVGAAELGIMMDKMQQLATVSETPGGQSAWEKWFGKSIMQVAWGSLAPDARQKLEKFGLSRRDLGKLPDLQAVLLHEILLYDTASDEVGKWLNVPYSVSSKALASIEENSIKVGGGNGLRAGFVGSVLLPAYQSILRAKNAHGRRFAALRVIEAIRLHAGEKNQWPASLEEITAVPVPNDPTTGKPFQFKREGEVIWLESTPQAGESQRSDLWKWRLELAPIAK